MKRCSLRLPYPRGSPTFGLVGALLFCKAADSSNKENRESRHSERAYCFHINVSHARKLTVDRTIKKNVLPLGSLDLRDISVNTINNNNNYNTKINKNNN